MSTLVEIRKTSHGLNKVEVDLRELIIRLQSIAGQCNIEVVQLAIASMLDEIKDVVKSCSKN